MPNNLLSDPVYALWIREVFLDGTDIRGGAGETDRAKPMTTKPEMHLRSEVSYCVFTFITQCVILEKLTHANTLSREDGI